jgi:hypothetical protein
MNANKAQDTRYKVMECLRSAIQRDEATAECIQRKQETNPLLIKLMNESLARADISKAVLYALETGDITDLRTFTKNS